MAGRVDSEANIKKAIMKRIRKTRLSDFSALDGGLNAG
jgi:hypothetical protein